MEEANLSDVDTSNVEKEFVFKIVVMGSYNVGKTTFIKRLLHTRLPRNHRAANGSRDDDFDTADGEELDGRSDPDVIPVTPTVGTDFYSRVVRHVTPNKNVRLQMWDTAGLARYTAVNETTYKNSSLVVCLFDISDKTSLEEVTERHLAQAAEFIPDLEQDGIFIVASKMDLIDPAEKKARAESQQRAASPEAAFCEEDDETTDLTSSTGASGQRARQNKDAPFGGIVTVKDVQEAILDLFAEVHYAEVSAKKRTGMSEVLQRICLALLRNEGQLTEEEELCIYEDNEDDVTFDINLDSHLSQGNTAEKPATTFALAPQMLKSLPSTNGTLSPTPRNAGDTTQPPSSLHQRLQQASPTETEGPPSVARTADRRASIPSLTVAGASGTSENAPPRPPATVAPPVAVVSTAAATDGAGGSWQNMGFSFDMGPSPLNSSAMFSPSSLPQTPAERTETPSNAPAPTSTAPVKAPVSKASWRKATAGPRPNETKEERAARERAELTGSLGKRTGAAETAAGGDSGTAASPSAGEDRFRGTDLDATEQNTEANSGRKFHSILDDIQKENDRKRFGSAGGADEDGADPAAAPVRSDNADDDGTGIHDAIQSRFADIEKSAEMNRQAMRDAEKKDKKYGTNKVAELKAKNEKESTSVADMYKKKKKSDSKCKCAVM